MRIGIKKFSLLFISLLFILKPQSATADEAVGKVVFIKGEATVARMNEKDTKTLVFDDNIYPLDTLQTAKGNLKILFNDQTVLTLDNDSKVLVTEYVYQPKNKVRRSLFDIIKGKVRAIVEGDTALKENDVKLQTPTAVAGIRGTDVGIRVQGATTQFLCFTGLIETYSRQNPTEKVMVSTGQYTLIQKAPPTPAAQIPPALNKEFTPDNKSSLKEILNQPGAAPLKSKEEAAPPPPMAAPAERRAAPVPAAPPPPPTAESPANSELPAAPPPPAPPPIVPGGRDQTPTEAAPAPTPTPDPTPEPTPQPTPTPTPEPTPTPTPTPEPTPTPTPTPQPTPPPNPPPPSSGTYNVPVTFPNPG